MNKRIIGCLCVLLFVCSCRKKLNEFLDQPPGVDLTEDLVFSSKQNADTYIANLYYNGLYCILPYWDARSKADGLEAGTDDEGETVASWYWTNSWNSGSITSNNNRDNRWDTRWRAIRIANVLLERIYEVPDADNTYKTQVKGEAKFIRALNNLEMLKYYGGVPLISKRLLLSEENKITRSSVDSTVRFIVQDCEDAIAALPHTYPSSLRGRATKLAAMMVKAKTLLFAASPMFNTAAPYLSLGENNNLICYGDSNNERWKLAADAARDAINEAPEANCSLITNRPAPAPNTPAAPALLSAIADPLVRDTALRGYANYKYTWEQPDNAEIILAEKSYASVYPYAFPFNAMNPPSMYGGGGSLTILFNFVKLYERRNGTLQNWDPAGGNDLNAKYSQLDPRFFATVAYNGSYFTVDYPDVQIYENGAQAGSCFGGHWLKKWIPDAFNWNLNNVSGTLFRLAEAYLIEAEALNEYEASPSQQAYDAVNIIRKRAGMSMLSGLTKDQFRARVHNERAVELSFEESRFWDLRRWGIAETEGLMKGNMYGLKIFPAGAEYRYEPYVFEVRSYSAKENLHPFPQGEVNKGYLIQNPGW